MIGRAATVGLYLATTAAAWLASPAQTPKVPDPAYKSSLEKWKSELIESRKQNWLILAGLFWLKPGENSFGTDPTSAIVFPKGPAQAGVFELHGIEVNGRFQPEAHATVDGKAVVTAKLESDTSDHPTTVEMGSLRFKVIVRGQRIGIRLKDLESPAVAKYHGPIFYPVNLNYRVIAQWVPSDDKKTVDVPNVLGDVESTPVSGTAVFKINGEEVRLTDLGGDPSKGLSFVFNDPTKKADTYPGGRFLETDPVVNGTVVIDFNRAYNPPCSVTPYATCPLAPKENQLSVAIPAGEKYDRAYGHH